MTDHPTNRPPSMDPEVVGKLFEALALAKLVPNSFRLDAANPDGIASFRVLVVDEHTYRSIIVPAMGTRLPLGCRE